MAHSHRSLCRIAWSAEALTRLSQRPISRSFSKTAGSFLRKSSYPSWVESPNTELSEFLLDVRSKAILPYYLNADQNRLVRNPENSTILENDPVTIQIGEIDETLAYTCFKTSPSRRAVIQRVLSLVKEPEDWENVAKLLEAFAGSNAKLAEELKLKILRAMLRGFQIPLILRILRTPDKYDSMPCGFEIVPELIVTIYQYARSGGWDEEHASSALSFAKIAADTMLRKDSLQMMERYLKSQPRELRNETNLQENITFSPAFAALFMRLVLVLKQGGHIEEKGNTQGIPSFSALIDNFILMVDQYSFLESRLVNGPWTNQIGLFSAQKCIRINLITLEAVKACSAHVEQAGHTDAARFKAIHQDLEQRLRITAQTAMQDSGNEKFSSKLGAIAGEYEVEI